MKINKFTLILCAALAFLIAFFLSSRIDTSGFKLILGIGCFISLSTTLAGTISVSFNYNRTTTLTKTSSGIFFFLLLISQFIYSSLESFTIASYLLVTGGLMILHAIIVYGLSNSKH
jgi:hypothetical protein